MGLALKLVTAPATEPVTRAEAKLHAVIDTTFTEDDLLVDALIKSAREYCERFTRRALMTQTWELYLDEFPAESSIELPLPPLQTVSSIKYTPDGGSQQTWGSSNYIVDAVTEPARIVLGRGKTWPADTLVAANGVVIRFDAGFANAGAVPSQIKQAALLLIGHWYENREAFVLGTIGREIEFAVKALLRMHEVAAFA